MKSFISSSRFIQPRRFESSSPENHKEQALSEDSATDNITSKSECSPDCVVSTESEESIADILCNLEQIYDRSFSKWDKIRKTDEIEHAMMRGVECNKEKSTTPATAFQPNEKSDATKSTSACNDLLSVSQSLSISTNIEPKSEIDQCTSTDENARVAFIFDVRCFVVLTVLLLILLHVSYTQRTCKS